jgi:hypothetical protein
MPADASTIYFLYVIVFMSPVKMALANRRTYVTKKKEALYHDTSYLGVQMTKSRGQTAFIFTTYNI